MPRNDLPLAEGRGGEQGPGTALLDVGGVSLLVSSAHHPIFQRVQKTLKMNRNRSPESIHLS